MNKIMLSNNISITNDNYEINNNIINIKKDGDYTFEYTKDINKIIYNFKDNINVNILEISIDNNLDNNITYNLLENTSVSISKFYKNKEAKEIVNINLLELNSNINYNFSNISNNEEQYKIIINHLNKLTKSNIKNKILAKNNSNITIDLDSIVKKDKIKCSLNQETRAIVFDKEKVNIKPNMYIECDDIEAKHSAVIGKFKDEEIFYLMTRGIPKEESIELLTESFLFSNLTFDKEEITNLINKYWR